MFNSAGEWISGSGCELGVSQDIERPVLAEGHIWHLDVVHLLAILQQFDLNLGRVELGHVAVEVVWLPVFWWVARVDLNMRGFWGQRGRQMTTVAVCPHATLHGPLLLPVPSYPGQVICFLKRLPTFWELSIFSSKSYTHLLFFLPGFQQCLLSLEAVLDF